MSTSIFRMKVKIPSKVYLQFRTIICLIVANNNLSTPIPHPANKLFAKKNHEFSQQSVWPLRKDNSLPDRISKHQMKSLLSKLKGKEICLLEQTVLYKNLQHPQTLAKLFIFYSKNSASPPVDAVGTYQREKHAQIQQLEVTWGHVHVLQLTIAAPGVSWNLLGEATFY